VLRCALTIDDAPGPVGPAAGAALIRRTLQRYDIEHCVAFVVGERALGHEAELDRWLSAGYQLGNHSYEHPHASALPARDFLRSVERCDALLHKLGAFDKGRPRYFRYPFGDRGVAPSERAAIRRGLLDLGYTLADVSISSYDYRYDWPLQAALAAGKHARVAEIERRFAAQAHAALQRAEQLSVLRTARGPVPIDEAQPHVIALHFTGATTRFLDRLLSASATQVAWIALPEVTESPLYAAFADELEHNGIIADALSPKRSAAADLAVTVLRRGARMARQLRILDEARTGPRWPSWSE
jgi:peptidoglycan/xylan/chitin deacetylase (PgdA/CDA1 family)